MKPSNKKEMHIISKLAIACLILAIATALIGNVVNMDIFTIISSVLLATGIGLIAVRIIIKLFSK